MMILMVLVNLMAVSARGSSQSSTQSDTMSVSGVTLFSSGVGHFVHQGYVDGSEEILLAFDSKDIDDLLKSLVLQDYDGGIIEAVTYPSRDPLSRILGSFTLNISENPSLAELLNQARGERVRIEGTPAVDGTVVGIEYRSIPSGDTILELPVLNLATDAGIRQVILRDISAIRFLNTSVQADLDAALGVIAANRQDDKKLISLRFTGQGRRRVSISYIREVPMWKTSYRLVLGKDGRAQLQGWAMVENTGENDWKDVSLALATGQPLSFVMDLYNPVYIPRPRLVPDYGVSLAPQEYDRERSLSAKSAPAPSSFRGAMSESAAEEYSGRDDSGSGGYGTGEVNLERGIQTAASVEGESLYRLNRPVSVPRREAALLPIIGDEIPAVRLSIFDAGVLADRPLKAVRITNTAGVRLPSGPVTVFDGAVYGGDARIPAMTTDEERLFSYAVDNDTSVIVRSSSIPEEIISLKVVDGYLETGNRLVTSTVYDVQRLGSDGIRLLIAHPLNQGWTVESGVKPVSETATQRRFEIDVPAGTTKTLTVEEHRIQSQKVALNTLRDDRIVFYLSQRVIDTETRQILRNITSLRSTLAAMEANRKKVEAGISTIHTEQDRIRRNLEALESGSELYRRYVGILDAQEDELVKLASELKTAQNAESGARRALADYISGL